MNNERKIPDDPIPPASGDSSIAGSPSGCALAPLRLLLSADDAAQALSISTRTLWTLSQSNQVLSIRIGRRRLYPVENLEAYIRQRVDAAQQEVAR